MTKMNPVYTATHLNSHSVCLECNMNYHFLS